MKTIPLILGATLSLYALPSLAQSLAGFSQKSISLPRLEIKQKKSPGFYKLKTGIFCTTPLVAKNGSYITGCNDGFVRIISDVGVLLKKLSINHSPDSYIAANPEIIALPHTKPEQFIVTSMADQIIIRFDASGKIFSKMKLDVDVGVPIAVHGTEFFMMDWNGVGHFYSNDKETMSIDTKSAYLNDPSTRMNSLGENQVILSDSKGYVYILSNTGEMRVVRVSKNWLSGTKVAPDGKVWVSDSAGIMYILDIENRDVNFIQIGGTKSFTRPVFLKNGKVAFSGSNYIYIFDSKNLDKPEVVVDVKLNQQLYGSGIIDDYFGTPMEGTDLAVIELADGSENIWVPTHGGYYFINSSGAVTGIHSYGKAVADAETFSIPKKLNDGTFVIGMFNGIDRLSIRKNSLGSLISSSSWIQDLP